MSRRVSLPAADDLFRRTTHGDGRAPSAGRDPSGPTTRHPRVADDRGYGAVRRAPGAGSRALRTQSGRKPSGRVRHDEKMTVYVTSAELLELEQARLLLRGEHGLAVDRGRLVREAIALVLADFEAHGDESVLVRRLTEE